MSGPYCKTCKFFVVMNDFKMSHECSDPSKIIYHGNGVESVNSKPVVGPGNLCDNHNPTNTTEER